MNLGIELADLHFRYSENADRGVGPLSLSISAGEHVGILGPSGCGKSTLLKIIAGLLPNSPTNIIHGIARNSFGENAPTPSIGFMFQHPALLPQKTVLENVCFPLLATETSDDSIARDLLNAVGLRDAMHLLPEQLSGGMRTRVSMARALVLKPALLLLDEPFTGLDIASRESAYQVIEQLITASGTTTVLVTHDLEEAWRMCDRIICLNALGSIVLGLSGVRKLDLGAFRRTLMARIVEAT